LQPENAALPLDDGAGHLALPVAMPLNRFMRYLDLGIRRPVSAIGLGTWQFGSRQWGYGSEYAAGEAAAIVRRAVELGVTFFDTAEVYGRGRSERILGRALAETGADIDDVMIATKILPVLPVAPVVEQRAVASAARLGVRRIDLYQVHVPNPVVPERTIMRGMRTLRQVGLVDEVGVSNYSLAQWQDADEALGAPVLSNQVQYSLVRRDAEEELVPFAARNRRLVIAFSPLAQGLLSGRYDENNRPTNRVRSLNALFLPENLKRASGLIETLRAVAAGREATPAQIALAWVIRHPNVAAIPGASSVEQLEHNVAAAEITLTSDELAALSSAAAAFEPVSAAAAMTGRARTRLHRR
jgi:aryl-alcohol dehydrogenase-like predicted oxidoreductase